MTDLVARLREAVAETERIAQAAARESEATWNDGGEYGEIVRDERGAGVVTGLYGCGISDGTRQHIARHDPAAVLRRCAADRKILDECEYEIQDAKRRPTGDGLGLAETMLRCLAEYYEIEP